MHSISRFAVIAGAFALSLSTKAIAEGSRATEGLFIREPTVQLPLLEAAQGFWDAQLQNKITTSYLIERRCDCQGPNSVLVDVEKGDIVLVTDFPSGVVRYSKGDSDKQMWGQSLPEVVSIGKLLSNMKDVLTQDSSKPLELKGELSWPLKLEIRTAGLLPHEEFGYFVHIYQPTEHIRRTR